MSVKQLFGSVDGQPKLVILDEALKGLKWRGEQDRVERRVSGEADNMTSTAQFALRRMIEQCLGSVPAQSCFESPRKPGMPPTAASS